MDVSAEDGANLNNLFDYNYRDHPFIHPFSWIWDPVARAAVGKV